MLILRAAGCWLALLAGAILNGFARVTLLEPRMSELRAHQASCLSGSGLILLVSWCLARWLDAPGRLALFGVGVLWMVWTIAFETAFGRFVAGTSWDRILGDYDLTRGRLWPLVLLTLLLAPLIGSSLPRPKVSIRH